MNKKVKDRNKVTLKDALRNPVLWAAALGLWVISSVGLVTTLILATVRIEGGSSTGISLFYAFFYLVSAGCLGYVTCYLSKKYGYKIDFESAMLPFFAVAVGFVVVGTLGGALMGGLFIGTVIACVLLLAPYIAGYLIGSYDVFGGNNFPGKSKGMKKDDQSYLRPKAPFAPPMPPVSETTEFVSETTEEVDVVADTIEETAPLEETSVATVEEDLPNKVEKTVTSIVSEKPKEGGLTLDDLLKGL